MISIKIIPLSIITMTVFSATTYGMHCITKIKPSTFTRSPIIRRSYNAGGAKELRELINKPDFTLLKSHEIIEKTLPTIPERCHANGLIEDIVFKATQYKNHEQKYAEVINQLHHYGWSISGCCISTMLHEAVKSDLLLVANELLKQKKELVTETDMDRRIPLHHVQSKEMAQLLIEWKSPINAIDKNENTPLHCVPFYLVSLLLSHGANIHAENKILIRTLNDGWQRMTPLRKAAYEGDAEKCTALLANEKIENKEINIAQSIAQLHYWRTDDSKFFVIYQTLGIVIHNRELKELMDLLAKAKAATTEHTPATE